MSGARRASPLRKCVPALSGSGAIHRARVGPRGAAAPKKTLTGGRVGTPEAEPRLAAGQAGFRANERCLLWGKAIRNARVAVEETEESMLSKEDNDFLCRIGPGTPMGDLMRHYWIPAIRSDELPEPD